MCVWDGRRERGGCGTCEESREEKERISEEIEWCGIQLSVVKTEDD